ncbi:MAG: hypothetical protein U0V74_09605 [Chitinophagales bacterium]
MKKGAALFYLILFSVFAFGQTERGRFILGGSADISAARQGRNSSFNMAVAPSFGVFVVKGLVIGGRYSFGVGNTKNYDYKQSKYISTTTFTSAIGPLIKYYPGKKQLKGLITLNGAYTTSTTLREKSVSGTNGFIAGGSAGIAYFINNNLSIESAFYTTISGAVKQLPVTRIGFQVGFFVFIDKKKKEAALEGGNP